MTVPSNWDKLTFSLTPTKSMFVAKSQVGESWQPGQLVPFAELSISPAASVLNYGQGIFEGMKALRTRDGEIVLFRPYENASRFESSAKRFCLNPVEHSYFVEAVKAVVKDNSDYIPPYDKGSLYIRPCLWGSGPVLGVGPSQECTLCIYVSPVGSYFKDGQKAINLFATDEFHRAATKGTGGDKFIGNYAGTMLPKQLAKQQGFDDVLYLDSKEERYVEEVGASNFFCVKGDVLYTPGLRSILPGIIRDSVITMAKDSLNLKVVEDDLPIEFALQADEAFCTGTAAVIVPIGSITYHDKKYSFNNGETGPVSAKVYELLRKIQRKELDDKYGWVESVS